MFGLFLFIPFNGACHTPLLYFPFNHCYSTSMVTMYVTFNHCHSTSMVTMYVTDTAPPWSLCMSLLQHLHGHCVCHLNLDTICSSLLWSDTDSYIHRSCCYIDTFTVKLCSKKYTITMKVFLDTNLPDMISPKDKSAPDHYRYVIQSRVQDRAGHCTYFSPKRARTVPGVVCSVKRTQVATLRAVEVRGHMKGSEGR